jgi:phosphatidylinositol alpha-mannosyltransferase
MVATFHRSGADLAYRAYGHLFSAYSRRVDSVIAVSEEAAETAQACIGHVLGDIGIIPNGVELRRLASIEPWATSSPTICFVGRHEPRKGLQVLLEAFPLLPDSTRLWVMGDGPEHVRLRSRFGTNPRIEWLGRVSDDERAARLAGADVFVAPSLSGESFGVVLLEAMATGTAVVASDLPGYRLAASGAARFTVPGDAVALADAIREVLLDDAERSALQEAGRARAAECDMASVADRYRDIYARLTHAPVSR